MDKETFVKGMAILQASYPERFGELDEGSVEVWYRLLEELPNRDFENAVIKYCRNHGPKEPPNPGAILETARELRRQFVSPEEIVQKLIVLARNGANWDQISDVFNQDPAAFQMIRTIGWDRIRYCHESEWPFLEKRIIKCYQEFREVEETRIDDLFLPHEIKRIQDRIPAFSGIGAIPPPAPPIKKEDPDPAA